MSIKHFNGKIVIFIVYVGDIVVTVNDLEELSNLKGYLAKEFEIKDLGKLRYCHRIEIGWSDKFIFIS